VIFTGWQDSRLGDNGRHGARPRRRPRVPPSRGPGGLGCDRRLARRRQRTVPGADPGAGPGRAGRPPRELAILVVAQHVDARFEWSAHEPIARREGTRPEAIEVVRAGAPTDPLTEPERLIVETTRALLRRHTLTDAEFARARDALGQARLVELVGLVGYYTMIAFVLVAFGVEPT
jgi:alkylhydroperoxidase family enzyme